MKKNTVICLKLLSIMLISLHYSCAESDLNTTTFSESNVAQNQNMVTSTVTKEENQSIYTTTYPLEKNGLVRIRTQNMHQDPALEVNLTIKRHHAKTVIVQGIIDSEIAKIIDYDNHWDSQWIHVPWRDDTIKDLDLYLNAQRNDIIRGGNRLSIEIHQPGRYILTVPYDADIEAKLSTGTINYVSDEPTLLKIDSTTVNQWGSSGSSWGDRQSWDYYWGDYSSPITKLFIKKGHINVSRHN